MYFESHGSVPYFSDALYWCLSGAGVRHGCAGVTACDLLCVVFVCHSRGFISCRRSILVITHKLDVADARPHIHIVLHRL
jgi:hypothetical protein